MKQYNFKITPELEERVKKTLEDSGLNSKSEFLEEMVTVYSSHLINRDNEINLDISAYKHINDKTKEVLKKTFNHLLSSIDYNFSSVLQEKISIEEEKKKLADKTVELDGLVNQIKVEQLEERKVLENKYEEKIRILLEEKERLGYELDEKSSLLIKVQEEFLAISTIAEQTSSVINENKDLRDRVSLMEREHKKELSNLDKKYKEEMVKADKIHLQDKQVSEEKYFAKLKELKVKIDEFEKSLNIKDKKLFEVTHLFERCKEDLELINKKRESDLKSFKEQEAINQSKLDKAIKELNEINSLYNQLLGKVEVFERFRENSN